MLTASVAYADLRAANVATVGVTKLQRDVELGSLMGLYGRQLRRVGQTNYELDVPTEHLEAAWLGDWEASYDIAAWQTQTYAELVVDNKYPAWTAVTGYYASFFAARALLYAVGFGARAFPPQRGLKGGLYTVQLGAQPTANTTTLHCAKQAGGGSHVLAWKELEGRLSSLASLPALDASSLHVLGQMVQLIRRPVIVSSFRNSVNYSLEIAAKPVTAWSTVLAQTLDSQALVAEVSRPHPARDENRLELLLLVCLSWLRAIYGDYLMRASRPDRRRKQARDRRLAQSPAAQLLTPWF